VPTPRAGGTIYVLSQREEFLLDPQSIYGGQDMAFVGATLFRSLESYAYSPDPSVGTTLTPDLATDLGTPTEGGRTWTFTLRDGVTFETGDPITCEDIRYGASRRFATDLMVDGPTYAITYLDIPYDEERQQSAYPGPYAATPEQQAVFDAAIECSVDHRTITFHLNRPVADFNYTTSLGFAPVPKAADTGQRYGERPISSGPYMLERPMTGGEGRMVLVRNPNWDPATDPIRLAYPDRWEIEFGVDPKVLDQRLIAATGNDAFALHGDQLDSANVEAVFSDPETARPEFAGRAVSDFDPYARFMWINVQRVTNVKIRQAMMVALDREAIWKLRPGEFYGAAADGVMKASIGQDYAPTGIWDTFFGKAIPDGGDPELAKRLIAESGETPPTLAYAAPDTPPSREIGDVVIESLGRAGITVEFKPPCPAGYYCSIVFKDDESDFGPTGWGADWPNASTVIPPLFTERGGWDLSHVDDPLVNAAIDDAFNTLDRAEQARKWQRLSKRAVEEGWVIPTYLQRAYTLAGTRVGPIYRWPAYSSWPYGVMFVTQ